MKIVSPYRPFPIESLEHEKLGPFDWIAALRMLTISAQRVGYEVIALTDVDTKLPVPAHSYVTTHRRLMLWILDVSLCYLRSADFDQDTAFISPDMLVLRPIDKFFKADLGVLVRHDPKHAARPILNNVQFWRHDAKARLIAFFEQALAIAERLPEASIVWGADTEPLVELLSPIERKKGQRAGLSVRYLPARRVSETGTLDVTPTRPIVDFRYTRKKFMAEYFERYVGAEVPA